MRHPICKDKAEKGPHCVEMCGLGQRANAAFLEGFTCHSKCPELKEPPSIKACEDGCQKKNMRLDLRRSSRRATPSVVWERRTLLTSRLARSPAPRPLSPTLLNVDDVEMSHMCMHHRSAGYTPMVSTRCSCAKLHY